MFLSPQCHPRLVSRLAETLGFWKNSPWYQDSRPNLRSMLPSGETYGGEVLLLVGIKTRSSSDKTPLKNRIMATYFDRIWGLLRYVICIVSLLYTSLVFEYARELWSTNQPMERQTFLFRSNLSCHVRTLSPEPKPLKSEPCYLSRGRPELASPTVVVRGPWRTNISTMMKRQVRLPGEIYSVYLTGYLFLCCIRRMTSVRPHLVLIRRQDVARAGRTGLSTPRSPSLAHPCHTPTNVQRTTSQSLRTTNSLSFLFV